MGTAVILKGQLRPDGSLELAGPVELPPGPVEVTVTPAPVAAPPGDWWQALREIRSERETCGHAFLSDEEVTAHIEELRADDDRLTNIERGSSAARSQG